jgi:glutaredoxin
VEVVLLTRAGCHLCADAWQLLEKEQQRYGFRLSARDVDARPELAARHGEQVPLVIVNGKVRLWGRINAVLLRRLLRAERRS